MMPAIFWEIRRATMQARSRLNDTCISCGLRNGKSAVTYVMFNKQGTADILYLTEYQAHAETLAALQSLTADDINAVGIDSVADATRA